MKYLLVSDGVGHCSDTLHTDRGVGEGGGGQIGHMTRNEKAYWMSKRYFLPVIGCIYCVPDIFTVRIRGFKTLRELQFIYPLCFLIRI
jgi:hypothetical protein